MPNGAEIGFLPRDVLLRELAAADVFVHATDVELEGMAVLEAMGAGLRTFVADAPESAAAGLALGPDFLFPAGNAAALAEKLDTLLESPGRLQSAAWQQMLCARAYHFDRSVQSLVRRLPIRSRRLGLGERRGESTSTPRPFLADLTESTTRRLAHVRRTSTRSGATSAWLATPAGERRRSHEQRV